MARSSPKRGGVCFGSLESKAKALKKGAEGETSGKFYLNDIAVNFRPDGSNQWNVPQRRCINCGDCITGCNVGAKNTLDTNYLARVHGVGSLTAMTFVLTLGDKNRFERSRDVGPYLGLRPRRKQSGDYDPELGITKADNRYVRSLLVECANFILGPFGQDSDLRGWGLRLAERGGKNARKRALVAVARKLAILLHRLWVTQAE